MGGLPHILAVGLLAAAVSSCSLLDLLLGNSPFDPNATDSPFPVPSATASYSAGHATIKLASETLVLDELLPGASTEAEYGTHVVWTNGDGWYLSYSSIADAGLLGSEVYLSLDRIVGKQHWVIVDPFRCVTTTTQADKARLAGTALCRGLTWSDYFSASQFSGLPQPIPSQPPFDADVTFEALSGPGPTP